MNRVDHGRAQREVGHEVTVHDVDVNHVRTAGFDGFDLFAKGSEVGRQDGRRDLDGACHGTYSKTSKRAAKKPSAPLRWG